MIIWQLWLMIFLLLQRGLFRIAYSGEKKRRYGHNYNFQCWATYWQQIWNTSFDIMQNIALGKFNTQLPPEIPIAL